MDYNALGSGSPSQMGSMERGSPATFPYIGGDQRKGARSYGVDHEQTQDQVCDSRMGSQLKPSEFGRESADPYFLGDGDSNNAEGEGGEEGDCRGEIVGRWSKEEHDLFMEGMASHGRNWKLIAAMIPSRTVVQIRTHAQKHFQKLEKCGVIAPGSRARAESADFASSNRNPRVKQGARNAVSPRAGAHPPIGGSASVGNLEQIVPPTHLWAGAHAAADRGKKGRAMTFSVADEPAMASYAQSSRCPPSVPSSGGSGTMAALLANGRAVSVSPVLLHMQHLVGGASPTPGSAGKHAASSTGVVAPSPKRTIGEMMTPSPSSCGVAPMLPTSDASVSASNSMVHSVPRPLQQPTRSANTTPPSFDVDPSAAASNKSPRNTPRASPRGGSKKAGGGVQHSASSGVLAASQGAGAGSEPFMEAAIFRDGTVASSSTSSGNMRRSRSFSQGSDGRKREGGEGGASPRSKNTGRGRTTKATAKGASKAVGTEEGDNISPNSVTDAVNAGGARIVGPTTSGRKAGGPAGATPVDLHFPSLDDVVRAAEREEAEQVLDLASLLAHNPQQELLARRNQHLLRIQNAESPEGIMLGLSLQDPGSDRLLGDGGESGGGSTRNRNASGGSIDDYNTPVSTTGDGPVRMDDDDEEPAGSAPHYVHSAVEDITSSCSEHWGDAASAPAALSGSPSRSRGGVSRGSTWQAAPITGTSFASSAELKEGAAAVAGGWIPSEGGAPTGRSPPASAPAAAAATSKATKMVTAGAAPSSEAFDENCLCDGLSELIY